MKNLENKNKKGFVLLMVILLITTILIVGLGVFDVIFSGLILSRETKESLKAFYAAESATDCALYWDKKDAFDSSPFTINCAASTVTNSLIASTTDFKIRIGSGANDPCADVAVDKDFNNLPAPYKTEILTAGYNLDCDSSDSRKVQRGVGARVK